MGVTLKTEMPVLASSPKEVAEGAVLKGKETDEVFRLVVEAMPNAIVLADPEGCILLVNAGAEKLFGYTREELIGRAVEMLLPERFRAAHPGYRMAYASHAEAWPMGKGRDLFALRKDGSEVPVEIGLNPVETPDGLLILSAIIDITERKRAEEATAQLVAIVESSDDAIIGKDLQGIVTSWNAAAEKIFGYSAAEMIGRSITGLIPGERHEEEAKILAQVHRGETVRPFETVRVRKDGSIIDVSIRVAAIRDPSGRIVGASKVARDITERRRTEKALGVSETALGASETALGASETALGVSETARGASDTALDASELRYRRLFETAKDGILILDAESGMVVDVNPFLIAILGYSHEEFLGKAIWELGFFKNIVANKNKFAEFRERQYLRYTNIPLETPRGQRIEVEFVSNVFVVKGTKVIQCNVRDVTARKKAEEAVRELHAELEQRVIQRTTELEAANKELESFSYSVSHDLRAPLRAVDGFSQAVLEDYGPQLPEEGHRYLKTIREGAQRMGVLIDDLLTFSRLSRAPLKKRQVKTGELVRGVLEGLSSQQEGRQIDLRIGELPACTGDPALLKQVWINLLSNALKYTRVRKTAVIEIGCSLEEGKNGYFVRDNGAGFDMRYAGKLFGVFQRLHRAEEYEGTGVGLAIVQRIVHRHGGRIWADGAVDRGATFYFTLEGGSKS